jgi:hypothetical protein
MPGFRAPRKAIVLEQINPNSPIVKKVIKTTNSPISPIVDKRLTVKQADTVMESVADLVSPDYKPKYFKALYRIGAAEFVRLADRARGGKYPPYLFRYLIDEAIAALKT